MFPQPSSTTLGEQTLSRGGGGSGGASDDDSDYGIMFSDYFAVNDGSPNLTSAGLTT